MSRSVDRPEMSTVARRMRIIDADAMGEGYPEAMDTT
jgi:hypothetical protein